MVGKLIFMKTKVQKLFKRGYVYRDIILDKSQKLYLDIFRNSEVPYRNLYAQNQFLGAFPRYIMEAIGISLIILVAIFFTSSKSDINNSLALLGVLALGAQKILPAAQNTYGAYAVIEGGKSSLEEIVFKLSEPINLNSKNQKISPLNFKKNIIFNNVSFSYNPEDNLILKNINFEIRRGERVGIIGKTGSGKSTTADLIMGLLTPTTGSISVDGEILNQNINKEFLLKWQSNIAHVPQNIYLADRSIAENIAFNVSKQNIDMKEVIKAAKKAQIADFIESIPKNYFTLVGERGIRLSGGQRQRIGIARALYKGANILILDEATSSVDDITERELIKSIESLDKSLTIIMIAHRLSTIKKCQKLIKLKNGYVELIGKPEEVL